MARSRRVDNGWLRRWRRWRVPSDPVRVKNVAPFGVGGRGANWTRRAAGDGVGLGTLRVGSAVAGMATLRGASGVRVVGVLVESSLGAEAGAVGASEVFGGDTIGAGVAMDVKMLVSWLRAAVWLSVSGARGDPAVGDWRALTMSRMPARTRSVELARGIGRIVGNHVSVSQMRVALVSQSQIV